MTSRLILNGKSAGLPAVRSAVQQVRDSGIKLEVRVTYEGGDGLRLAQEACHDGVERIVAGGGGGSIHEVLNGMLSAGAEQLPMLGIMPLGATNDFASGCALPKDLFQALHLAVTGDARMVDVGRANDRYFLNVAAGGFAAAVTTGTPASVKKILGGAAYSLLGMVMAANFQPHQGVLVLPDRKRKVHGVVGAVSNGCQAGGGQPVAPLARIDDGLLDVLVVREFPMRDLGIVIDELQNLKNKGRYISYHQVPWLEVILDGKMPMNLDGEATVLDTARFEVLPGVLPLVLGQDCPLVSPLALDSTGEEADGE
jgi:lipid kinase YegS